MYAPFFHAAKASAACRPCRTCTLPCFYPILLPASERSSYLLLGRGRFFVCAWCCLTHVAGVCACIAFSVPSKRRLIFKEACKQRCFFFLIIWAHRPVTSRVNCLKGSTSRHKATMIRPIAWHLVVCLLLFWRVSGVPLGGSGKKSELSGAAKAVDEIRVVPGFKGPLPSRHFSGFDQKSEG